MSNYAIWFEYNKIIYRLPVNPEEIKTSKVQANQKYEILKRGQIVVPTYMELTEYSFEVELPNKNYHYVETSEGFKGANVYLNNFKKWREKLVPVQFIAGKVINDSGDLSLYGCINTPVLIEEISITEKAGEEGDKYVSFKLLEYKPYGKIELVNVVEETTASGEKVYKKGKSSVTDEVNPNNSGYYTVQSGDCLWSIAKKFYGDGSKCNMIYYANKDKIINPALIKVGWKLIIPGKNDFSKYSEPLPKTVKKEPPLRPYYVKQERM